MKDRCCILGLFETMFLKFELLRNLKSEMVHSCPLGNNVLEVGTAEKKLKARRRMVHYDAILKDVLEVGTAENLF